MKYKAKPLFQSEVTTSLIWASSAYAQRINTEYVKFDLEPLIDIDDLSGNTIAEAGRVQSQRLAHYAIMHPEVLKPKDYKMGDDMFTHFEGLIFKAIAGQLTDFDKSVLNVVERKDWNDPLDVHLHFAVLVSLGASFERAQKRDALNELMNSFDSEHFGQIKERLRLTITVLKSFYHKEYNTNYITGVTADKNIVFFSYKTELPVKQTYEVYGTIKAHRDAEQTQLNRVSII